MKTKYCTKGKHDVSVELFYKRSQSPDGLSPWCRPCVRAYDKERYHNGDKERKQANKLRHRANTRKLMWDFLCKSKCMVCKNSDPEVLEFDHRDPSEKEFDVSEMVRHHSWERILIEIAKCDVLCANCHRKRTIRQFGFWRGTME